MLSQVKNFHPLSGGGIRKKRRYFKKVQIHPRERVAAHKEAYEQPLRLLSTFRDERRENEARVLSKRGWRLIFTRREGKERARGGKKKKTGVSSFRGRFVY